MKVLATAPVLLLLSLFLFASHPVEGQRGGSRTIIPNLNRIDQAEGRERLEFFRSQRLVGDYIFQFSLTHHPRRGERMRLSGTMWGSWNEFGPVSRVVIEQGDSDQGRREWIIQNGREPMAWQLQADSGLFLPVGSAQLFQPLVEGMEHSLFDLQMPFLYWMDMDYAGPTRVNGRPAQQFMLYPPDPDRFAHPAADRVRLSLDDGYNALLRVDFFMGSVATASLRVRRFREVADQWIVREIDLVNEQTRDRTQFTVNSAALGIVIPRAVFDPHSGIAPKLPPPDFFETL